ncbi:MAG: hypothetical protein NTW36_03625 [Planctomycetia bacterium]|nr:hypothetical protein [Planctomycetia bacterium]
MYVCTLLRSRGARHLHHNKHIRQALAHAAARGWRTRPGGGHAFCILLCPEATREGCLKSVWSTPRNPEAHARDIIRFVDRCPHGVAVISDFCPEVC